MVTKPVGTIAFTQQVVFKDSSEVISHSYEEGDVLPFYSKNNSYWVTPVGGIYFDEAKEVE